ncbi:MAG TPA: hydroxyisourate hydrolase [Polyangia bacterium]|nr:hydroxyisourate hydrolase [Polyangia bacterium]
MSRLSTHVLDVALGRPAAGVALRLEILDGETRRLLATAATDTDGRAGDLLPDATLAPGTYRLTFETGAYFQGTGRATFYPRVEVTFQVTAPGEHHHVPLLLSPFGYSTYRGS